MTGHDWHTVHLAWGATEITFAVCQRCDVRTQHIEHFEEFGPRCLEDDAATVDRFLASLDFGGRYVD